MKTEEIEVGAVYSLGYYRHISDRSSNGIHPTKGVGKILKVNAAGYGWHEVEIKGVGTGWASSRSIGKKLKNPVSHSNPVVDAVDEDVQKLVELGFDDSLRRSEVELVVQFLGGLGIAAYPTDTFSGINIPYMGLAKLKVLAGSLYSEHLRREMEELEDD